MELLVMALLLAAILAGQYLLYSRLGLKNLSYSLTISSDEAFEGEEIEIIEEIENAKALPLPWIRTEISCSRWLTFKGQQAAADGEQRGLISGVFLLKGHQKCRRAWRVRCEKRGVFTVEDAAVSVSDLFGLAKPTAVFGIKRSIRVLPLPADMDAGEMSSEAFIGDIPVKRFVLPDPFVISGAQEYSGREPMNRIHWAHSARIGTLMVYSSEYTTERSVLVILNMQRNGLSVQQKLSVPVLEAQIKAAAFVLDDCCKMRMQCALSANAAKPLIITADEGYEHTMNALRNLAELKNGCSEHIDDFIREQDFNGFTDVIFISCFMTQVMADTAEALYKAGKCCKLFTTDVDEESGDVPPCCEVRLIPRGRYYPPAEGED